MEAYLALLKDVLDNGEPEPSRARLRSTGNRVWTRSVFGRQIRVPLDPYPLVTTKKMSFSIVVHELIWFLRGDTNIKYLNEHKITIWDEWAKPDGDLGPIYGAQWRRWKDYSPTVRSIDQIATLRSNLKYLKIIPELSCRRRLLVSAWNVSQLHEMRIEPCHFAFQLGISGNRLNCHTFIRSCDLFLGLPYNIACYALLTNLFAKEFNFKPGELVVSITNAHIYDNHVDAVEEQIKRVPLQAPKLDIAPDTTVENLSAKRVKIMKYKCLPAIPAEIAV